MLISPIQAAHQSHCAVYDYLARLDEEKSVYESQRLLYVAVTRAKSRLYLLDSSNKFAKKSFHGLLKNQVFEEISDDENPESSSFPLPIISKLPLLYYQQIDKNPSVYLNQPMHGLSIGISRLVGIVTHQLLQWICDHHPSSIADIPWHLAQYEFKKLGFDATLQNQALDTVKEQICQLFQEPRGQWIISQHEKERNEYELLVEHQNRLVTRIIDRTFEHAGKCWIIDFKTGKEDKQSLQQHQQQLNDYAFYLSNQTDLPIHCGLYYLLEGHWVDWQYEPDTVDRSPGTVALA